MGGKGARGVRLVCAGVGSRKGGFSDSCYPHPDRHQGVSEETGKGSWAPQHLRGGVAKER